MRSTYCPHVRAHRPAMPSLSSFFVRRSPSQSSMSTRTSSGPSTSAPSNRTSLSSSPSPGSFFSSPLALPDADPNEADEGEQGEEYDDLDPSVRTPPPLYTPLARTLMTRSGQPTYLAYYFIRVTDHSMVLVSPTDPQTPLYHVAHQVDMFNPLLFNTILRRGGARRRGRLGQYDVREEIGEFNIGISQQMAYIRMGDERVDLSAALKKGSNWGTLRFALPGSLPVLTWSGQGEAPLECKAFDPPRKIAYLDHRRDSSTLFMTPQAMPHFDLILLSLLAVQRIRSLTDRSGLRQRHKNTSFSGPYKLFNFDDSIATQFRAT
ncbi:hypothetical protein BOTBODRAFT_371128 [Botryobasidium botryosum FD-172 SS1]|uniref:Uncharacterized protein n=1 Tax=Botryobasidium botryosum (strain FD-172 SS1) TaxID=930990 RepID=A0A067MPP7_BOTB1|nr:hypothetical protein BOTBODRAFT_371128 [Botryobasidium botryosum FD-172 SS1]